MAGVVAIMVLLFVMSTIRGALAAATAAEARLLAESRERNARTELAASRAQALARQSREGAELTALFDELRRESLNIELSNAVDLAPAERRIRLQDATFSLGSACLTPAARAVLVRWSIRSFRPFLERHPDIRLAIEGHTDGRALVVDANTFIARPGHRRNLRCALFDDNFTLSAARAREAREAMLGADGHAWPTQLADRVMVAGYGSSRPRQGLSPDDPRHRRVEILVLAADRPELSTPNRGSSPQRTAPL
jgi:chemotaxis protein MotB